MKLPALYLTASIIGAGAGALALKTADAGSGFFLIPFTLGPLFVSLALSTFLKEKKAQRTLAAGSVAYAIWFSLSWLFIFHGGSDPQRGLGFLFIGVYSLPVMIIVWVVALLVPKETTAVGRLPATTES